MKIEGFTQEEIDFMENVPNLLATEDVVNPILYAALLYNNEFNTLLTEDEFHDRFDDYMSLRAEAEKAEECQRQLEENVDYALIDEFMKQEGFNSGAFRKLLAKYEKFRNGKIEKDVRDIFDIVQPNIDRINWFADNFTNNFKFLSSWRFW